MLLALYIKLNLEMFLSKGVALKGSYEIQGERNSKNMFDLLRLSISLINFHLKVKKKILKMLVSFPDCPVSIITYRKRFIFPYKPCIYSQPWHTWGKKKKKAHTILDPVCFYTLTGGISERAF